MGCLREWDEWDDQGTGMTRVTWMAVMREGGMTKVRVTGMTKVTGMTRMTRMTEMTRKGGLTGIIRIKEWLG